MNSFSHSTFKGALLVAGTSIGGGMLALPILTSQGGFLPSLVIYLACWVFMASTGLLFLEISLWMKKDVNIVSMAKATLGKPGEIAAWVIYLFLFYSLTLAYIVGCGNLIVESTQNTIPDWLGPVIFLLGAAPLVVIGARLISKINLFLMFGLGISFILFVIIGWKYVNPSLLQHRNWNKSLIALPIAFTSFAYQGIIPTLVSFLNYDVKKTIKAILIGSFTPLLTYILWQWLILGIIPSEGPHSLSEALEKGQNAVQPLKFFINHSSVYLIGQFFAFFALVTSFFGVTLGLFDFLADGLTIKKDSKGKLILCLMVFLPPLFLAFLFPHVFLKALDLAGGFGCALLLGLMPILMVWSGRYIHKFKGKRIYPGGKISLSILLIFLIFELYCEIFLK